MSLEKLKPWPTSWSWDLYVTTNHFCVTRNFIVGSFSAILALVNKSSTCAACSLKFTYFNIVPQFFSNNHRSTPAPNGASVYSTRIFPVTVCHCSSVARLRPPRNSHLHISRINRSPEFLITVVAFYLTRRYYHVRIFSYIELSHHPKTWLDDPACSLSRTGKYAIPNEAHPTTYYKNITNNAPSKHSM